MQVYVDDIIFGSINEAWCREFEDLMKGEFQMSAMGERTFFLGLKVQQKQDGIFISQDKYVRDMLKKLDMENVRTATTPYDAPKPKVLKTLTILIKFTRWLKLFMDYIRHQEPGMLGSQPFC